jgi:hypothetical protein
MSDESQSVSNAPDSTASSDESTKQKDVVDYASFQKAVAQKKAFQQKVEAAEAKLKEMTDKLTAYESAKSQEEENKNREAGEWQKVVAAKEKQIEELKSQYDETKVKYEQTNRTLDDAVKLNAVYAKLPGKIKNAKYSAFIDLDKVAINPESGEIDMATVDEVVNVFVKEHRELLDTKNFKGLPGDAASGMSILNAETFRSKPLNEMKKALPDAVRAAKKRMGINN